MDNSPAHKPAADRSWLASPLRRLGRGFVALEMHERPRIKVEDVALAVGYFLLFWLLDSVDLNGLGDLGLAPFDSAWPAIATVGCMGVPFRRRVPLAMAWMCGTAVLGLLLAGHGGAFILAFEFFFSLVLFGSPRASRNAATAAWALTALAVCAAFAVSRSGAMAVSAGIIAVITLLTPVEWAENLRKAQQLADSEHARANAVEEAGRQRLLAERSTHDLALDRERQHLARELHDVLSARLSAIALQSGAALHVPTPASPAPAAALHHEVLSHIRAESVAGLAELNAMIRLLHTGAAAETTGQLGDLDRLVTRYLEAGMDLSYSNSLPDGGVHLPAHLQSTVYRVAAEALVNATKHAPDAPASMELSQHDGPATAAQRELVLPQLVLTVSTPLPLSGSAHTASVPAGSGTGLASMHFRATLVGGTVTAGPVEARWQVLLQLPLAHDENERQGTSDVPEVGVNA